MALPLWHCRDGVAVIASPWWRCPGGFTAQNGQYHVLLHSLYVVDTTGNRFSLCSFFLFPSFRKCCTNPYFNSKEIGFHLYLLHILICFIYLFTWTWDINLDPCIVVRILSCKKMTVVIISISALPPNQRLVKQRLKLVLKKKTQLSKNQQLLSCQTKRIRKLVADCEEISTKWAHKTQCFANTSNHYKPYLYYHQWSRWGFFCIVGLIFFLLLLFFITFSSFMLDVFQSLDCDQAALLHWEISFFSSEESTTILIFPFSGILVLILQRLCCGITKLRET